MKIRLSKSADIIVGALRVSLKVNKRLVEISKKEGVTRQEIIRAILDQVIDDIEI